MTEGRKFPHTYVIIFYIILVSAVLTWIVPGGSYQRETVVVNGTEREVIKSGSFTFTGHEPQTWQVFAALYDGFVDRSDIIVFILIIGGAFWIINSSRAIDAGIQSFLRSSDRFRSRKWAKIVGFDNLIIVMIMLLFSIFGATFGMSEETIAFVVLFIPLSVGMGYDSILGVCMCFVAAALGFAGALLNPFTIGIAQGLSDLPLFSGIEYRFFCWVVINLAGIGYVLRYASRIRKKPGLSPVYAEDHYWREGNRQDNLPVEYRANRVSRVLFVLLSLLFLFTAFTLPMTRMKTGMTETSLPVMPVLSGLFIITGFLTLRKSTHFFVLNLLAFTILLLIAGVMGYQWYIMEIAALFMALGLLAGIAMGFSPNTITRLFLEGVKDILPAALVVGLAGGIIILLTRGQIVDSLLYYASGSLRGLGKTGTIGAMYLIQTAINLIIPSGSAKAALTIPVMAQFSDLVGLSRQANIMAFQFGDGFTNMITPTSGVLIGVLGVARIPFGKWVKWVTPLMIILILLGFLLLLPTVYMDLIGF